MVSFISLLLAIILHLKGFGRIFSPLLPESQFWTSKMMQKHSREIKYINRNLFSVRIYILLYFEGPKQSSDTDEGALLRQCLTNAHPPSPTKCHIAPIIGKWSVVLTFLEVSFRVESIGFGEVPLVPVNRPQIPLNPCVLRYQPALAVLC